MSDLKCFRHVYNFLIDEGYLPQCCSVVQILRNCYLILKSGLEIYLSENVLDIVFKFYINCYITLDKFTYIE